MLFNAWAEVLKERRAQLGITQELVVDRMPSVREPNTYGRWERGEVPPSPQYFDEIARALELSVDELGRRYTAAMQAHYFPETRESRSPWGGEDHRDLLDSVPVEGLPPEIEAHLLRQKDGLRGQLSGLRLSASGIETQIASFAATVSLLRQRLIVASGGEG